MCYLFNSLRTNGLLKAGDLSAVGRVKMNMRLGFDTVPDSVRVLRKDDVVAIAGRRDRVR